MPVPTLQGQKVVVIGGSSGIGLAVAQAALAEGAQVVIGSSSPEKVDAAVAKLGDGASGAAVNVRDEANVQAFFESAGPLDHLAYTAGDWDRAQTGAIAELDFAAAAAGMEVRFWGALRAIKHALPRLSPKGSITLTDGVRTHKPSKGMPLSSAFGAAIEHLAKGLAIDLAPRRVNAVCPGFVLTDIWNGTPPERIAKLTERFPVPQAGDPADVAQAYVYLMKGGYTTGQVLVVDGGLMLI
ncbi:MAG TPA: SDR family oxidoreductase [Phenylobacterium sp.]|jgi:NAD(P)-dependent dehydrogenase (short-subunit alcohol dehydrogenase family)|uniref:SDR family oxidoreductase n=1 Tax=Phenylobacterium sp. TaxID=1871053 RepID=UPI002D675653|nr:SDR family oxidoreductase [Phenylobacterium sp.]HZZ67664.1 SDR family oxidoreductase [Phenylobacterium sp.]